MIAKDLLALFLGLGCATLALITLVFWRKTLELAQEVITHKNKLTSLESELNRSFEAQKHHKEEGKEKVRLSSKLEKDLKQAHDEKKQFLQKLTTIQDEFEAKCESLENQLSHYKQQTESMTTQLLEVEQQKIDRKQKIEAQAQDELKRSQKNESELKSSLASLKKQLANLESQHKKTLNELQSKLEVQSPEASLEASKDKQTQDDELRQVKHKLQQYHHLYQAMRGHKEMLEERNENWEKALRMISSWVLSKESHPDSQQELPSNLGTLVGQALEFIRQGPLVDDEFSLPINEVQVHDAKTPQPTLHLVPQEVSG